MFNLDQAIEQWRQQLAANGINSLEILEELESHLREEVRQQMASGLNEAQAFAVALERIGEADALRTEFCKIGPANLEFLRKLKRFLLGRAETPFPSLENFAPSTREMLELAPIEARHLMHDFVGTEHLLLSLTQASSSGAVGNVMRRLGADSDSVRLGIEKLIHHGAAKPEAATIPFTPRAKRALQLAISEVGALKQDHVRPEHVLLGLLLEGSGVASLVLKELGVRIEVARGEVLKEIHADPGAD